MNATSISYVKSVESHIPTLDGWRAIAISCVLLAHASESSFHAQIFVDNTDSVFNFQWLGLFGVKIFFALSGFLITTKLLQEEEAYGAISVRSFMIRRAFRILPACILFLIAIGTLSYLGVIKLTALRWLASLFFLSNYLPSDRSWYVGHFWSLAVEEHFYLIWPLAFVALKSRRYRIFAIISAAL